MIEAISCGGVVIFRGKVLLLYKNYMNKSDGWVLPKGTVEEGAEYTETALREVLEESGAKASSMKYIGKTNEKIVYSRGLPMYFISDVNSDDVMARTGVDGRKLILSKDFKCWDQGEYLGEMSEETKQRMRSTTC